MGERPGPDVSTSLPLELSSFVGRETEISQIAPLILTHRLVTLIGSGGVGKTRLAFEVASRLSSEFAEGVRVVELASLNDPVLVPKAVAQAIGAIDGTLESMPERLAADLDDRELLLVFDNCEHLIEACADLAESLLRTCCSDLRILATSREPLGVPGEIAWRVPPMSAPRPDARNLDLLELERYDALCLFVERAREAAPSFALTQGNAIAVTTICQRLDGIPLAIELAAARIRVLTVEQIAARVEDALNLLGGGARGAPARHRTIRATIDWSYDLLSKTAAAALRRLSVFRRGCTLEAASAVCADMAISPDEPIDLLTTLVDKSLVVARTQGAEMRYELLETIRQYAWERLESERESEAARERHLSYYLRLAERAKHELRTAAVFGWLERLDLEQDNFRAALAFTLERAHESQRHAEQALRLTHALELYWRIRGHYAEGLARVTEALAPHLPPEYGDLRAHSLTDAGFLTLYLEGAPAAQPLVEASIAIWREFRPEHTAPLARALRVLGQLCSAQGDRAEARRLAEESLSLFRRVGDQLGIADALWSVALSWLDIDNGKAREIGQRSLDIYERLGDHYMASRPRHLLGNLHLWFGEYAVAQQLFELDLAESRKLGHKSGISAALLGLAWWARWTGDVERAATYHWEGIELNRESGIHSTSEFIGMGYVSLVRGRESEAVSFLEAALDIARRRQDDISVSGCLIGFANVKCRNHRFRDAAMLLAAAQALCERAGSSRSWADKLDWDRCLGDVRRGISPPVFERSWADGHELEREEAVALVVGNTPRAGDDETPSRKEVLTPLQAAKRRFEGLTARERDVAACVARGWSNREIADELSVSERTVEAHIGNILSKLQFTSRTHIATWALQKGLGGGSGDTGG